MCMESKGMLDLQQGMRDLKVNSQADLQGEGLITQAGNIYSLLMKALEGTCPFKQSEGRL